MPIGVHGLEVPWAVGSSSAQKAADGPGQFVCPFTKKKFKTKATYDNYLASKKYKDLAAASALAANRTEPSRECEQLAHSLEQLGVSAAPATTSATLGSTDRAENALGAEPTATDHDDDDVVGVGVGGDDDDDGDWEDEPWEPRWGESLFDGHQSPSFESNAAYMRVKHSFFVPDVDSLADPRGLFSYLQEKVCRYHTCLCCHRAFVNVEACRSHMREKGHCKLNVESEACALEICEFYEFGAAEDDDDDDDDGAGGGEATTAGGSGKGGSGG